MMLGAGAYAFLWPLLGMPLVWLILGFFALTSIGSQIVRRLDVIIRQLGAR